MNNTIKLYNSLNVIKASVFSYVKNKKNLFKDADGKRIVTSLNNGIELKIKNMFFPSSRSSVSQDGLKINNNMDGSWTVSGVATNNGSKALFGEGSARKKGDVFYIATNADISLFSLDTIYWSSDVFGDKACSSFCGSANSDGNVFFYVNYKTGADFGEGVTFKPVIIKVSEMFNDKSLIPNDTSAFDIMFHSEGSDKLGYIPYSKEPVEVVAYRRKLYYK